MKVLSSICQQIWKTQQWPQDWKRLVFIPIPKRGSAKECFNYHIIVLISHASKVTLKILQVRLQQYVSQELPDIQTGFKKAEEPEIKLPTFIESSKKQKSSRKTSTIDYAKAFGRVDYNKLWKILEEMTIPDHPASSCEICMRVKKQQLEPDVEQWTGSQSGKESDRAVPCLPVSLTSVQSTSCEMLGWMNHQLESRLPGEISTTSDEAITPL